MTDFTVVPLLTKNDHTRFPYLYSIYGFTRFCSGRNLPAAVYLNDPITIVSWWLAFGRSHSVVGSSNEPSVFVPYFWNSFLFRVVKFAWRLLWSNWKFLERRNIYGPFFMVTAVKLEMLLFYFYAACPWHLRSEFCIPFRIIIRFITEFQEFQ